MILKFAQETPPFSFKENRKALLVSHRTTLPPWQNQPGRLTKRTANLGAEQPQGQKCFLRSHLASKPGALQDANLITGPSGGSMVPQKSAPFIR